MSQMSFPEPQEPPINLSAERVVRLMARMQRERA